MPLLGRVSEKRGDTGRGLNENVRFSCMFSTDFSNFAQPSEEEYHCDSPTDRPTTSTTSDRHNAMKQTIELLAPAKNADCGMAAIDHGADAVYIGADRFGARAAAGNSVADIERLCAYAHRYAARVYVTVNTLLYDDELEATQKLVWELYEAGADAILVQDMALLEMNLPPIALHASTQTDNRTAEKVRWLADQGFSRVVLARELSVSEIAAIHRQCPDVALEVFVHGALCVSYSGVCYASQHCFGRSANRGECAQFCRMPFDLVDADGREIEHGRHLLSLKDMAQIDHLEALMAAGASSFKIEGRLKDISYVKNVVAAYSRRFNDIIAAHPTQYVRSSRGEVNYTFMPDLQKTFHRGYTSYFLNGRQPNIASFDTPKAMGEFVGTVKEIRGKSLIVAGTACFANGDGLCFINHRRELEGFRVNRAEGNRLFPATMPSNLRRGLSLYRNADRAFEQMLAKPTAVRSIPVTMVLDICDSTLKLRMATVDGETAVEVETDVLNLATARTPQADNICRQLTKLGNTPYVCREVMMDGGVESLFIPSSLLASLRRNAVEQLSTAIIPDNEPVVLRKSSSTIVAPQSYAAFPYLYNIANRMAVKFYKAHGLSHTHPAFELDGKSTDEPLIMLCRHCIKYALGRCERHGGCKPNWTEPLYLRLGDGRRFRLQFDCKQCEMSIYAQKS